MKSKNNSNNSVEDKAAIAASVALGAIMNRILDKTFGEEENKPYSGIRKMSDKHFKCGVKIPDDGTAAEIPVPEDCQVFISEDGRPMIRKKPEAVTGGEDHTKISYEDIARRLYLEKTALYPNGADISRIKCTNIAQASEPDNCTSKEQVVKIQAYGKLLNIAKYLNKGWKPKFDGKECAYLICKEGGEYKVKYQESCINAIPYFKEGALAEEAVRIMGTQSLDDIFSTNW